MFVCSHCDSQSLKWQGRCSTCGKWGTLMEESPADGRTLARPNVSAAATTPLSSAKAQEFPHASTGIPELDRVLSGGLVAGSVTLLAGEPGIGKSTLVAQLASSLKQTYYVSGEESESQVLLRFTRLNLPVDAVVFSAGTEILSAIEAARAQKPKLMIVDSIQTMSVEGLDATAGTPNTVRAATSELIAFAKSTNTPVVIIGQVTKDGSVAGPKTLEHLVDTVLTLEGDAESPYRILRAGKHRFGATDEIGVFEMTQGGMMAVENPSARFLAERGSGSGSVVTCVMEGSRPMLVEIQALVDKSFFPTPVRRTSGVDQGRMQMLLAILSKRAGVRLGDHDVYVNVVGGLTIREKAVDLAIAAAVLSAAKNIPFPADAIVVGELGLGGEVRSVPFLERRLKEAERLGITKSVTPKSIKSVSELSSHLER